MIHCFRFFKYLIELSLHLEIGDVLNWKNWKTSMIWKFVILLSEMNTSYIIGVKILFIKTNYNLKSKFDSKLFWIQEIYLIFVYFRWNAQFFLEFELIFSWFCANEIFLKKILNSSWGTTSDFLIIDASNSNWLYIFNTYKICCWISINFNLKKMAKTWKNQNIRDFLWIHKIFSFHL